MEEQMTFSYDEADDFDETGDFDETDDFDETGDFNETPEDMFLAEDDDDAEPNTALSQALRQAGALEDEDEADEDEDDTEEAAIEEDDAADNTKADEQPLIEAIEALPDEDADDLEEPVEALPDEDADDLVEPVEVLPDEDEDEDDLEEVEPSPLELAPTEQEVEHFRPEEQGNFAYADAVTAYYEENDYPRAIEKFNEAIEYEMQSTDDSLTDANEIVAKSKYWQAEAYVKLQDLPQAIGTFEDLVETCQTHYLSLAAQRRADELNAKNV